MFELTRIEGVNESRIIAPHTRVTLSSEYQNLVLPSRHRVSRSPTRCRTHVLEHEPPLRPNLERGQIFQIFPVDSSTSKDVHDVVDECRGVPFSRYWDVSDAGEFGPDLGIEIVGPRIVVMVLSIRSSEAGIQIDLCEPSCCCRQR